MDRSALEKVIQNLLTIGLKRKGVDTAIKRDDPLISCGLIDSLSALELISQIEKKFHIKILPEEMIEPNFDSIIRIADLVCMKLKK